MVDRRRKHVADQVRTALAFRYGDHVWRSDPTHSQSSKPVNHRLANAYLKGLYVPTDGPATPVDELCRAIPLAALIFRSPLWTLLRDEKLDLKYLQEHLAGEGLAKLGREFQDLAMIEEIVVQTELDLVIAHIDVIRERVRDSERRLNAATAPRLISDFDERFGQLLRDKIGTWHAKLAELEKIAQRFVPDPMPTDCSVVVPSISVESANAELRPESAFARHTQVSRVSYVHLAIALSLTSALPWVPVEPTAIVGVTVALLVNAVCAVSPTMRVIGGRQPLSAQKE